MRSLLVMIRANMLMSVRNRTALFWNLAFPALFILLFGAILGRDNGVEFTIGVVGPPSALKDATVAALESSDAFDVKLPEDEATAEEQELDELRDGDRDVVVVFGTVTEGGQPTIQLYYDQTEGPNAQVAVSVVRQVLLEVIGGGEGQLAISEQGISSEDVSYIDFFVPGILAMSLMNSGVIGMSTVFVAYRERGILRRIKVTPFSLTRFILARIVSQLIIGVIQAVILVGLARLAFGLDVEGNPLLILLGILIGGLAFFAIGFVIAAIARNVETAASYANLVTFPMLFLSGVFFEVDSVPNWLRPVTKVLPLSYLVDALREPMTRGRGVSSVWIDLVVLTGTFAVAMILAVRFFRWDAKAV